MRRRFPALALALGLVAVLATSGGVLAHGPDPLLGGEGLYPQGKLLEFRWLKDHVPPAAMATAILDAATDSNASRISKSPVFGFDPAGPSFVMYGGNVVCGVNGLACMRRDEPDSFRMYFREQGHVFDWGTMKWCQMYKAPAPNGCYDTENVALDEFGHVLILGHHLNFADDSDYLDAVVQTFSRTKPKAGWDAHAYARCDVATLQLMYGLLLASNKVSTCIGLETVLGLTPSVTSGRYDSLVRLTATLKIADHDNYVRLGGQVLSGRTVVLERRPIGGAWATVGTMTAGSTVGTYVLTTPIRYTADYRAVFAKPTGDGVLGDVSPTVRVSLGICSSGCPQAVEPGN
jgi:hypothetical protein